MAILMISANPLLVEAATESMLGCCELELHSAAPGQALERLAALQPQVVLLDDALPAALIQEIMLSCGLGEKKRVILFSAANNELYVMDTTRVALTALSDLFQSIRVGDPEAG